MTVSVMLTFWEGGGAPHDSKVQTYAGTPEHVRERAIEWLDAHLFSTTAEPTFDPLPTMGLWADPSDWEDNVDAAA